MKEKKILIVSYFANRKACCPAEWVDDKIDSLLKLESRLIVVSSLISEKYNHPNIKHYRVPSLSPKDLKHEISELYAKKQLSMKVLFWLPLIVLFGIPLDIAQYFLTNGMGGGKWSWAISSFLCCIWALIVSKVNLVLTTGGPASAHLSGVCAAILFGKKRVCELQDPLSGEGIGRNSKSAKLLFLIEKFLIQNSHKIVYVTKQAYLESKEKFSRFSSRITFLYPGSKIFNISDCETMNEKLTFVHLGTLYSTRNFNNIVDAIDKLISDGKIKDSEIELINRGDIYGEYLKEYQKRSYFQRLDILPRQEAIEFAAKADVLLLVQHNDPRSLTTIPYKTYDYLNIKKPILALVNNPELKDILEESKNYCADVDSVEMICEKILQLYNSKKQFSLADNFKFDPVIQASKLIEV